MMRKSLLGGLLAASVLAGPCFAQASGSPVNGDPATQPATTPPPGSDETARGYADPAMPHQDAINAGGQADTAALNSDANANLQTQQALNAANQAIYAADAAQDTARYDAALEAHAEAVHQSRIADAHYHQQQRAYAEAVSLWRVQVRECLAGHKRACDAPPPDPASFY